MPKRSNERLNQGTPMNQTRISVTLASLIAVAVTPAIAAEPAPDQVVAAIEAAFGVVPGQRRNHIKGFCTTGEFVGTPEAGRLSRSALFSGQPVPVVGRFSLAGGNPKAPDTAKSGRGLALQFKLPGGQIHQMAMLNTPMFGAASVQTFLDLMQALKPDPATGKPDPEKLKAFKASHPDNAQQAQYLAGNNPPASYANSAYWGIHTVKFLGAGQATQLVKWRFVPQDGEKRLSDEELKTAGAKFLENSMVERTRKGPVRWDMMVTLGQQGDEENDPTQLWPDDRKQIKAGTLTLTAAGAQAGAECERINFDPMVMADGIAPTADPVLRFRSPAYGVSFAKRLGGS
jgi:catalase